MEHLTTQTPTGAEFDARALLGFNFPTADLLGAAADLLPSPARTQSTWGQVLPDVYLEGAQLREGSYPRLEIGPGILRLRRHDLNSDERAHRRAERDRFREVDWRVKVEHDRAHMPMWAAPDAPVKIKPRGRVSAWSAKSRANLVRSILSLDLAPLTQADRLPVMVTLTLPNRWREVAPDAATASRKFDNFRRAWAQKWGAPSWIWKREFQRRGAPHWHLWLVPPSGDLREFQAWLSHTWTTCLQIEDPEEYVKSLAAGTNVSATEGMRARDPKRLAVYFLKESLGGEGKAYQNDPPADWGESTGRYWGVTGIRYALRTADLEPEVAVILWRVLRRIRASRRVTKEVRVARINQRTGEVRYRKVRRRVGSRGTAGWIAVNDGAAAASQLARWLSTCVRKDLVAGV